jgi:hypothetical protein
MVSAIAIACSSNSYRVLIVIRGVAGIEHLGTTGGGEFCYERHRLLRFQFSIQRTLGRRERQSAPSRSRPVLPVGLVGCDSAPRYF